MNRAISGTGSGAGMERLLRTSAVVSAAIFVVGLFVDPKASWSGYLAGFACVLGVAIAGPFFLAIRHLADARWAAPFDRIARAMSGVLPIAGVLGLVLLLGVHALYEWADAAVVQANPLLHRKAWWLTAPFFAVRLILIFGIWIWLSRRLIRKSDVVTACSAGRYALLREAAVFLLVFAVTLSIGCVDWFQSLEPEWFSTMYSLAALSGIALSGVAVVMVVAVLMRRTGSLRRLVSDDALDDLGKVALSLSLLWVYLWFCQYMLIWYTNMPEETSWYEIRRAGGWSALGWLNLALNWLVPFATLMPRTLRRNEGTLLRIGCVILVGRVVDILMLVGPPLLHGGLWSSPFVIAPVMGAICVLGLRMKKLLARAPATGAS